MLAIDASTRAARLILAESLPVREWRETPVIDRVDGERLHLAVEILQFEIAVHVIDADENKCYSEALKCT